MNPTPPKPALPKSTPILCYVEQSWAYFTTQPLDKQRGDDWNDEPYQYNAGQPYRPPPGADWQLFKLAWYSPDLATPADMAPDLGPLSVDQINAGAAPWLQSWRPSQLSDRRFRPVLIPAGTGLVAFVRLIRKGHGSVYLPFNGDPKLLRYGFPAPLYPDEGW